MAPNLKNLKIALGDGTRYPPTTNERWQEFMESFLEPLPSLPRPVSISLDTDDVLTSDLMLAKWGEHFDLSDLVSLDMLQVRSETETSSILSGLKRLERLFIDADNEELPDYQSDRFCDMDYGLILGAITPLKTIRIRGVQKLSTIYKILKKHGQSLETFIIEPKPYRGPPNQNVLRHLYPVVKYEDIVEFARLAPHLRELRLTIERSKGNLQEQQLYHALALFPSLRHLIIDLHYKSRSSEGLWEDLSQCPVYKSPDFKDALVNAAMDAKLAMQIWHLIGAKRQKENLHSLRNLRLTPIGWDLFEDYYSAERRVMSHLSRAFLTSNRGLEMPLEIREIGREERQLQMRREAIVEMSVVEETYRLPSRLRPIVKFLWNLSTSEMADWSSHWTSFPLKASQESET